MAGSLDPHLIVMFLCSPDVALLEVVDAARVQELDIFPGNGAPVDVLADHSLLQLGPVSSDARVFA